jgi:aspartate aminotransferase
MSFFDSISQLPEDPILGIGPAFAADPRPNKVNLGIGSYKDADGMPYVLTAVKKAEALLLERSLSKDYLPIEGYAPFLEEVQRLIFGKGFPGAFDGRAFSLQTVGGTSALRVGGEFLSEESSKAIFIPNPSWSNHKRVFGKCGMMVHHYRYYDQTSHRIDFAGMCSDIELMPPGSTLLLHACCHNPTGVDLSMEQWEELSQLINKRKVIPFFDLAYQGFKGTVEEDASPIRLFVERGHELFVANSFSKNFGLYGERVGTLTLVTEHRDAAKRAASHLKLIVRGMYSNPPRHVGEIIYEILRSGPLRELWLSELAGMRDRMQAMRKKLVEGLAAHSDFKDWSFLLRQAGFFSFLGLDERQVRRLLEMHAVYMLAEGRINVSGLNARNIDTVVHAIVEACRS